MIPSEKDTPNINWDNLTQNYSIIKDEEKLKEFIEWLPELGDGEQFYVSLFSRKKYATDKDKFKADKSQLKRFTSSKEYLFDKIKKLEVEIGSYFHNNVSVPQENLALYITPNPRSFEIAMWNLNIKLMKCLKRKDFKNPQSLALSEIQIASKRKIYFDIDIDVHPDKKLHSFELKDLLVKNDLINLEAVKDSIVMTRGGYHILVNLEKIKPEYVKKWYNNFARFEDDRFSVMMNNKDNTEGDDGGGLLPVPGCTQGNYVPKLIKL